MSALWLSGRSLLKYGSYTRRRNARGIFLSICLALLLGALVLFSPLAPQKAAEATPSLTLEATYPTVQNGWGEVEWWRDNGGGFQAEDYPPDGRGDQNGQRLTFFGGVERPHSSRFLLYHAPG